MEDSTKTLNVWKQTLAESYIIEFKGEKNLLDLLRANKISISESCGGFGTCTTCRVIIQRNEAAFLQRTELEVERATERNFSDLERLSCQCQIVDSAEILIP
jgi:ferredoxin